MKQTTKTIWEDREDGRKVSGVSLSSTCLQPLGLSVMSFEDSLEGGDEGTGEMMGCQQYIYLLRATEYYKIGISFEPKI